MKKTFLVMAMVIALAMSMASAAIAVDHCQETGATAMDSGGNPYDLTANHVNEVPTEPFDVTCDIGIYFDEAGTIDGAEINGTEDDAKQRQHGIYIDGVDVDITNTSVAVEVGFTSQGQFNSVLYTNGATGTISDGSITGAHRAGIVLRGGGTDVTVTGNEVVGTGAAATGWAENGIQVDRHATGTITDNLIQDHGYATSAWGSTGLLIYGGNDVTAHGNALIDNTFSIGISVDEFDVDFNGGNDNNLIHNDIQTGSPYGAVIFSGDNNGFRHNEFSATDGAIGIYIAPGTTKTKLIRNSFDGWTTNVYDGGDDTVHPRPFR